MSSEYLLKLHHVGLCYQKANSLPWRRGKFWALEDVNFEVKRGQTVGIMGRNGAGKSSLLRVIAGIINPDRGKITYSDLRITLLSFGAGFENRLTGRQNIMLNGLQLGISKKKMKAIEQQIIELSELHDFIDTPVYTYSNGMRARLGFSIAYHVESDVLLIDEALATGDEAFKLKATKLIQERINSDLTVIIVSHALPIMRRLCDRIIQIEYGCSLPELSVEETIKRYQAGAIQTADPRLAHVSGM